MSHLTACRHLTPSEHNLDGSKGSRAYHVTTQKNVTAICALLVVDCLAAGMLEPLGPSDSLKAPREAADVHVRLSAWTTLLSCLDTSPRP